MKPPTQSSRQGSNAPRAKFDSATELNVYADVYKVLLGGMLISTVLFVIGILRALLRPQLIPLSADWIKQHYHWSALVHGIAAFDATTILMLATALLILTPVARVVVSIYAFAVDGDRQYVVVTSIVLLMIVLATVLGLLGLK